MTDSVQVFDPGFRVLDSNGDPVSGAKIKFYEVGPGAAKNVYSDKNLSNNLGSVIYTRSDGYPVVSSGSTTTTLIYVGSTAYYVTITDANDVAIFPAQDNVRGALDTSTFLTTGSTSTLLIHNVSCVADLTLGTTHNSKAINAAPGGGTINLTLTAAATLGDGWSVYIRHTGTNAAGRVNILGAQATSTPMGSTLSFSLLPGAGCMITCDGAAFSIEGMTPAYATNTLGVLAIASRVNSLPVSPTAGARYIATGVFSATPAGNTAVGDIIEATGQSTWIKFTPPTDAGWLAYVADENQYYSFQDSAWVNVFPQSSDTVAGLIELAVQSEMEAASDVVRAVVPGRQKYHPGHPKAWVNFNGTGTLAIRENYNVSSVTDNGTGDATVNFAVAFSTAGYAVVGCGQRNATDSQITIGVKLSTTPLVGSCRLVSSNGAGAAEDAPIFCCAFFGDQA
jgi:hypothetical protein